ncbi:MAG: hypothetical protein IJT77_04725, partial [Clostridia bacterium]|nr:hypothetical protein [Clostridia bacterium]
SVKGTVWADANVNSKMDAGEAAVQNVYLTLVNSETGSIVGQQSTNQNGAYVFENLRRGTYALEVQLPNDELFTDRGHEAGESCITPTDGNEASSDEFALASGEAIRMNIGSIRPGVIGDTVWQDIDNNGLQDYKEPRVRDIPISLWVVHEDGSEDEIASLSSDEYGYYHFTGLRPGRYRIQVDESHNFTLHYGAGLDEIDSDILPETGSSDVFLLQSGERKLNADIGILDATQEQCVFDDTRTTYVQSSTYDVGTGMTSDQNTAYDPGAGVVSGQSGTYDPSAGGEFGQSNTSDPGTGAVSGQTSTYDPNAGVVSGQSSTYDPSAGAVSGQSSTYDPGAGVVSGQSTYNPGTGMVSGQTGTYDPGTGMIQGQ